MGGKFWVRKLWKWAFPSGLRVRIQVMPQDHQKLTSVIFIITFQRLMDIVADHVANLLGTVWLFQQGSRHRSGRNLRNVLMLRYGPDFLLGQTTQGNAVLKRNHNELLFSREQGIGRCQRQRGSNASVA